VSLPDSRLEIWSNAKGNSKPMQLFKSSIIYRSSNPTWTFSGLIPTHSTVLDPYSHDLVVHVYLIEAEIGEGGNGESAGTTETLVVSEEVDLTRLVPIKYPVLNGKFSIPINFMLLNIEDGLYTTESLFNKLFARSNKYVGEVFTVDDDAYDAGSWKQTSATLSSAILDGTSHTQKLREIFSSAWDNALVMKAQVAREDRLVVLQELREQVEIAEADVKVEQSALDAERSAYANTQTIARNVAKCRELMETQLEYDELLNMKKLDLLKVKFLLQARQTKLLSELQTIYPIERLPGVSDYAIRGVELPLDLYSKDDEQIAAALGYLVHLLLLASKYLEVPLRYQLLFMGSRSFIRDPVAGGGSTLPLFRRNVEKDRFDRAVLWLKRNVEQLLVNRGIAYEPTYHILRNVHSLFQCEMCPKIVK